MSGGSGADRTCWHDEELLEGALPDKRIERRLRRLLEQMSTAPGQPVPAACGDWAATKAAYRFFDNPRVTEHGVMSGHFAATSARCAASEGPILILQDTTEFIYNRAQPGKIGFTKTINGGQYKSGQPNAITLCGVLMHSILAVTLSGTPLGLTAVKFWTRMKFKGTLALKRHVNPTRVPIETKESHRWLENPRQSMTLLGAPERCVHVADRESDIYELYCLAQDLGTRFLVRVQTDRLADTPKKTRARKAPRVFAQLAAQPWCGDHRVIFGQGENDTAEVKVKFDVVQTLPPIGKQKHYRPQLLTYIHALEADPPVGRAPIDWKLVTNLPVHDLASEIEKLNWYALCWKAGVFHKVMKSGCRAEQTRPDAKQPKGSSNSSRSSLWLAGAFSSSPCKRAPSPMHRQTQFSPPPKSLRLIALTHPERARVCNDGPSRRICWRSPLLAAISPAIAIRPPRQHGRLAWSDPPARHRLRHLDRISATMWVIESFSEAGLFGVGGPWRRLEVKSKIALFAGVSGAHL